MIQRTPAQWLALKVRKGGPDECWPWTGSVTKDGYGQCWIGDRIEYAHRVALSSIGVDIEGKVVRHSCDNRPCCNPRHLAAGTHADNVLDTTVRGHLALTKLSVDIVLDIRAKAAAGINTAEIARQLSLNYHTVRHIVRRRTWKHL